MEMDHHICNISSTSGISHGVIDCNIRNSNSWRDNNLKEEIANDIKFEIFTLVASMLYFATGTLQLLSGFIGLNYIIFPANPLVGIVLICISFIFITGTIHYSRNQMDAYAFLIVGMILAGIVFILHVITILTNLLGWVLQLQDWINWTMQNEITPGLWLFPLFAILLRLLKGSNGSLFEIRISQTGEV